MFLRREADKYDTKTSQFILGEELQYRSINDIIKHSAI